MASAVALWFSCCPHAAAQTASDNTTSIDSASPGSIATEPYGVPSASGKAAPAVGSPFRLGNLSAAIGAANVLEAPVAPLLGLTIVPSLSLQEELTTNALGNTSVGTRDFITTVTPGLLINEQTRKLHATIDYAPNAQIYARAPSEDYVGQNLNARADATLLPRALLLSLRGFATEQSTIGGLSPGGTNALPRNNRTSTESFEAGPTAFHRFGRVGTAILNFRVSHTIQTGSEIFAAGTTAPFFLNTRTTTEQEFAAFTTGSFLGRFNDTITANAEQNTSNLQVTNGARAVTYSDTLRFAVTRHITVIGEVGKEHITYGGTHPTRINGILWNAGLELNPAEGSTITAEYGHDQGFNSAFINGSYPITARTQIHFATSEFLGTQALQLQNNLADSLVGPNGGSFSSQTGAPLLLTNQLLATQSSLFRSRQISVGTTTTWSRDVLGLSFLSNREKLISSSNGLTGFSQNTISGSIRLSHALSPVASATAYLQYGRESTPSATVSQSSTIFSGQLSFVYHLSETLTADALYTVRRQVVTLGGTTALTNIIAVGMQKRF